MVFIGGPVTCPVDDPTPLADAELDLERLPEAYIKRNDEGIVLLTAGKIADKGPGAGCDGPIAKIARDVRLHIGGKQPVTLLDFKAGFEDSARGVLNGVDWAIVVVDPTNAAIQLAFDVKEMVKQTLLGRGPATQHLETPDLVALAQKMFAEARIKDVSVVLNRVQDEKMAAYLIDKLAEGGIQPIGVMRQDPAITISWLEGEPITSQLGETADGIVRELEDTLRQPAVAT
jgi:CO dehydrogenase nickel-insertion accessory protein CooC1